MNDSVNWNTAQLLKSTMAGAKKVPCYWRDKLSPIIDKVYSADALIIGVPIYFGKPTSQYFAFVEKLRFLHFPMMITNSPVLKPFLS